MTSDLLQLATQNKVLKVKDILLKILRPLDGPANECLTSIVYNSKHVNG